MICPWAGNLIANFWKKSNPHPVPYPPRRHYIDRCIIKGWMIVSYMLKEKWLILSCCPIIGRGITNFLQLKFSWYYHQAWDVLRISRGRKDGFSSLFKKDNETEICFNVGSLCSPPSPPLAWENSRHFATPPLDSPRYSHIPRGGGEKKRSGAYEEGYLYSGLKYRRIRFSFPRCL